MPLALLAFGMLAVITGIKGNEADVANQLKTDLTGSGNFLYWIAALVVLAIIGRVGGFPNAAKTFMALIVVVYVLSQNGLWANATSALAGTSAASGTGAATSTTGASTSSTGSLPTNSGFNKTMVLPSGAAPPAPTLH